MLRNMQIDETKPNWTQSYINRKIVSDETQLIQLGESTDRTYYEYTLNGNFISGW